VSIRPPVPERYDGRFVSRCPNFTSDAVKRSNFARQPGHQVNQNTSTGRGWPCVKNDTKSLAIGQMVLILCQSECQGQGRSYSWFSPFARTATGGLTIIKKTEVIARSETYYLAHYCLFVISSNKIGRKGNFKNSKTWNPLIISQIENSQFSICGYGATQCAVWHKRQKIPGTRLLGTARYQKRTVETWLTLAWAAAAVLCRAKTGQQCTIIYHHHWDRLWQFLCRRRLPWPP
jgi:hypothetical protein